MKRIYGLFFSLFLLTTGLQANRADTLNVSRAIILGVEITGPVVHAIDNTVSNYQGYLAYRLTHKYYLAAEAGYGAYSYEQYNYTYNNNGVFFLLGTDINLLKPELKTGNHYAGIGLRYGLSVFNQETPWFKYENYWGSSESSISNQTVSGHFLQLSGGIKAELFRNIFIGWTIRLNLMVYHTGGQYNKPVNIPGLGGTDGGIQPGISFHVAWQIPIN